MKPLVLLAIVAASMSAQTPGTCPAIPSGFSLGLNGGTLGGFRPFPTSVLWNRVDSLATDSRSTAWMNDLVFQQGIDLRIRSLYPSTENGIGTGHIEGFLYHVVSGSQRRVNVGWYDSGDGITQTSLDPGPYPVPFEARVKNTLLADSPVPNPTLAGDGHVIVIDRDNCLGYIFFKARHTDGGALQAAYVSVFDLLGGDNQRPFLTPSGSVSGLPLIPNYTLVNQDELVAGQINHPIFGTAFVSGGGNFFPHHSFLLPASMHQYGNGGWAATELPIGSRLRMKSTVDTSSWPAQAQVLADAMKKYGVLIGDGGGTVDYNGTAAPAWDHDSTVYFWEHWYAGPISMDVPQSGAVYCDPYYTLAQNGGCPNRPPTGSAPAISTFQASSSNVTAGQPVTLTWSVSGAGSRIRFVTPEVGPVVSNSVVVQPSQTTTYTLMVQNSYGRATRTATVTVGSTVPQTTLTIGANLDSAHAASLQATISNSGATTSSTCSTTPCSVSIDPTSTANVLTVQYRSASGKIVGSTAPMPIKAP